MGPSLGRSEEAEIPRRVLSVKKRTGVFASFLDPTLAWVEGRAPLGRTDVPASLSKRFRAESLSFLNLAVSVSSALWLNPACSLISGSCWL
jgi:hypothetical protein